MDDTQVELELCPNCKKEIPQINYVMHTAHCARNIALCPICKEPIPKGEINEHRAKHEKKKAASPAPMSSKSTQLGSSTTWKSKPYTGPFPEKLGHGNAASTTTSAMESVMKTRMMQHGAVTRTVTNGINSPLPPPPSAPLVGKTKPKPNRDLAPCRYCELELPKDTMQEHEEYCGARTDKCNECGEIVMYRNKKLHEESNHGFIKLNDEPGPKASWDSTTQRSTSKASSKTYESSSERRSRRFDSFDMTTMNSGLYNVADYLPPSLTGNSSLSRYGYDTEDTYRPSGSIRNQAKIDYKDLSRRLDCKTEYIRNLLHDSASITAPLRSSGTAPRNHFNHNKGPAPQPPAYRRPNPSTELTIPCEFCQTPIPHEDLIQHETGCRPDLARFNPRRRRQEEEFYRYTPSPPPTPASPEVELPCEFCSDLIPASQLLRHQATCN